MKRIIAITIVWHCCIMPLFSQNSGAVKGNVIDAVTERPIQGVTVQLKGTSFLVYTNALGEFLLQNLPSGNQMIQVFFKGYESKILPVNILKDSIISLGTLHLYEAHREQEDQSIISLTEEALQEDGQRNSNHIAGLFQSSKDAFLQAAAYNFSQAWFKVRGYDSRYGDISINGLKMNKLYDGRPQWSNWGGLNDVFRNQTFNSGISVTSTGFGGLLGSTNFSLRASEYRAVKKVSLSSTNRSYKGRTMATYTTGFLKNNWAFAASGSYRIAREGYIEGTSYNAWSGFMAAEKKLNNRHSINIAAFAASNIRGKSSPNTQEVTDLKGVTYNSYWGYQEGKKRNSRIKNIFEPLVLLTHYYESEKTSLKTTVAYQFGRVGNSRLGYFNAPNPDPTYWKYLPSNFLRFKDNPNYANAYITEQDFLENGQINWQDMYQINSEHDTSLYYLYEDRVDDTQLTATTVLNSRLNHKLQLYVGASYKLLASENYGNMIDLLGGTSFMDLDQYATGEARQNDLNNPDRDIGINDVFQYNYTLNASVLDTFLQLQYTGGKVEAFVTAGFKSTGYQREGHFKNGSYSNNSFGKSDKQSFADISAKVGATYKITGRHLLTFNGAYLSNAPTIRTAFSNARVNNNISPGLKSEKILSGDMSYLFRSPKLQTRLTAYYTLFSDAIETSFFFAEGLLGDQADFVNEITTGIDKKHLGGELSISYQATPSIKILGAGSFGQFTYDNNPQLYLESESFANEKSDFGTAYLKNYHISGTPQRAYSLGFEYRDPEYWWFQINTSLLTHHFLDISPLLRTDNFYKDSDGAPFVDPETGVEVTQEQVNALLSQEKFDDVFLVNAVGGKSWKVNDYFIGFFIGANNILGEVFKSGGFEQSRKANYLEYQQDKQLKKPIFGPKYWYGNDTSYYVNVYVRF